MDQLWAWYWTQALPTISLNAQTRRLRLRDFISQGLIVDFAALITASGNTTWWATSDRGGTDTVPTEGELGFGADDVLLTRIQSTHSGARLLLNHNTAGVMFPEHFGDPGESEWTLRIQTVDDVVETNTILSGGNSFINFGISAAADRTIIDDIDDGDHVIVAAYKTP